jgi:hypothetical protein
MEQGAAGYSSAPMPGDGVARQFMTSRGLTGSSRMSTQSSRATTPGTNPLGSRVSNRVSAADRVVLSSEWPSPVHLCLSLGCLWLSRGLTSRIKVKRTCSPAEDHRRRVGKYHLCELLATLDLVGSVPLSNRANALS